MRLRSAVAQNLRRLTFSIASSEFSALLNTSQNFRPCIPQSILDAVCCWHFVLWIKWNGQWNAAAISFENFSATLLFVGRNESKWVNIFVLLSSVRKLQWDPPTSADALLFNIKEVRPSFFGSIIIGIELGSMRMIWVIPPAKVVTFGLKYRSSLTRHKLIIESSRNSPFIRLATRKKNYW